jgi:hypothetical protein
MDIKIVNLKKSKYTLFKEFEYVDLIPYAIALIMIFLLIYFLYQVHYIFPEYVD